MYMYMYVIFYDVVVKVHPISHLSSLCYACYIMRDVCPGGTGRGGAGGGEFFRRKDAGWYNNN